MNLKYVILSVAIVIVGVVIVLPYISWQRPITTSERTLHLIKYCEWLESGEAYLARQEVEQYLHTNEGSGLSLGQIFFVMKEYPQHIPEKILGNTNIPVMDKIPTLNDAWGRPLNFLWRSDGIKSNVCDELLQKHCLVLVWSSGPNGSNEWGKGDDIFVRNE